MDTGRTGTWRAPRSLRVIAWTMAIVSVMRFIEAGFRPSTDPGGAPLWEPHLEPVLFCVVLFAYAWLTQRFLLRVDESGVTVRNLRTTHVPWADVKAAYVVYTGVEIERHSGMGVVAWAAQKAPLQEWLNLRARADEAAEVINSRLPNGGDL